jgi:uncharacterized membrane protein YbhN (UPF0104 family)
MYEELTVVARHGTARAAMSKSWRRRLVFLAKLAVSLGLMGWLIGRMVERDGIGALRDRLTSITPAWIAVAIALHAAAVVAGTARWRIVLARARIDLPFSWLLRSFLIGRFIGAFTPSTMGLDGWRLWESGRASGSMARSTAAIAVEKLLGLSGMALVCALLVPLGSAAMLGRGALVLAASLGIGAALFLFAMRHPRLLAPLRDRIPRLEKAIDALGDTKLDARSTVRALALGVISHLALSAVFWASARTLSIDIDASLLFSVGNAIVVAVLLPISIGGVGVRESVAVLLLASVVSSTDAVLIALVGYLTGQVPALVGGLLLLLRRTEPEPVMAEQTLS